MRKAIIRFMITNGCGAGSLDPTSKQCYKILPYLAAINSDWKKVNSRNFGRFEHVQHEAFYGVLCKLITTPPTKEEIEAERQELIDIAVDEGKEPPPTVLLPEEMEQQSEECRSSEGESVSGEQSKKVNFSPPKPHPQKDGDGDPHHQLLGKRSHSRISSEKDALHFEPD